MGGLEQLAVLAAGFAGGLLTSTVGVASLATFPVLLALAYPPWSRTRRTPWPRARGLSGSWGYRRELGEHPRLARLVIATCAVGSIGGAVLLLALPSGVFERVVPWLILFTCLLVGLQPLLVGWLRRRGLERRPRTDAGPSPP